MKKLITILSVLVLPFFSLAKNGITEMPSDSIEIPIILGEITTLIIFDKNKELVASVFSNKAAAIVFNMLPFGTYLLVKSDFRTNNSLTFKLVLEKGKEVEIIKIRNLSSFDCKVPILGN